jgi:hypothetical protein
MRVFSADNSSEQFEEQLEDTVIEKGECKCNRSVRTEGHSLAISRPNRAFRRYAGRIPELQGSNFGEPNWLGNLVRWFGVRKYICLYATMLECLNGRSLPLCLCLSSSYRYIKF